MHYFYIINILYNSSKLFLKVNFKNGIINRKLFYYRKTRELCFELIFKNLYITIKLFVKIKNNKFLFNLSNITNAFFLY